MSRKTMHRIREGFKLLVIEHNNTLREKIAGILSRLDSVAAVCQVRDLRALDGVVRDFRPHMVLVDMDQALEHESQVRTLRDRHQAYLVIMTEDDAARCEASDAASRINAHEIVEIRHIGMEIGAILARAAARPGASA